MIALDSLFLKYSNMYVVTAHHVVSVYRYGSSCAVDFSKDIEVLKSTSLYYVAYLSRYCLGVMPITFLNACPKWLWEEKPS